MQYEDNVIFSDVFCQENIFNYVNFSSWNCLADTRFFVRDQRERRKRNIYHTVFNFQCLRKLTFYQA